MNTVPGLWWVYDSNEKTFSTLPTGPFLVPGLLIMGAAVLWQSLFNRAHTIETIAGHLVSDNYWKYSRQRYSQLTEKWVKTGGELSAAEYYELEQLERYLYNPHVYQNDCLL